MLIKILKAAIYPKFCIGCNNLGDALCRRCDRKIDIIDFPICMICGRISLDGSIHKFCNSKYYPLSYLTPFIYSNFVKKIIIKSKTGSNNYKLLDSLIFHKKNVKILQTYLDKIDLIVYIPMTTKATRFVDHGKYISEQSSKMLNKPTINILKKSKTEANKTLSRSLRFKNLSNSIYIEKNSRYKIKGKSILLIDDISTTGATLLEASEALYKQGATSVYSYSLAKET